MSMNKTVVQHYCMVRWVCVLSFRQHCPWLTLLRRSPWHLALTCLYQLYGLLCVLQCHAADPLRGHWQEKQVITETSPAETVLFSFPITDWEEDFCLNFHSHILNTVTSKGKSNLLLLYCTGMAFWKNVWEFYKKGRERHKNRQTVWWEKEKQRWALSVLRDSFYQTLRLFAVSPLSPFYVFKILHSTLWMCNTHTVNNKVPDEGIGVWQSKCEGSLELFQSCFKDHR